MNKQPWYIPFVLLLRSRKFWLAVASVVLPALLSALTLDPSGEIGQAIQTLAYALIAAITIEDSAAFLGKLKEGN